MFIWITTIPAPIYFGNFIVRNVLLVGHVEKIEKICYKLLLQLNSKEKGIAFSEGMALCCA